MEKMKKHKIIKQVPLDKNCFASNESACEGIGLKVYITEDEYVVGICKTKVCHQGYANTVHGGIICTYFDEVLWYSTIVKDSNVFAVTAELNIKYLQALPTEEDIKIIGEPVCQSGRHLYTKGYILANDDKRIAEATAHFIIVKPDHRVSNTMLDLCCGDDEMPMEMIF